MGESMSRCVHTLWRETLIERCELLDFRLCLLELVGCCLVFCLQPLQLALCCLVSRLDLLKVLFHALKLFLKLAYPLVRTFFKHTWSPLDEIVKGRNLSQSCVVIDLSEDGFFACGKNQR